MKKKEKVLKHNGNISIWKFIFSLLILIHHSYLLNGYHSSLFLAGSIGVEFFFIVSGYLLAKKVYDEESHKDKRPLYQATCKYIFNRIKTIMPFLLFSYILYVLLDGIFVSHSLSYWLNTLYSISFLHMSGIETNFFFDLTWFLSGLILGMSIIYPLLKKYKKNFSCLWSPIIAIFLLGFLLHPVNGRYVLRTFSHWYGFAYVGMLRAVMNLSLGVVAYEVCEKLKKINFTKVGSAILSLIEIIGFIFVIIANTFNDIRSLDALYIAVIFIGIIIGFSEKTLFFEKCNNKIFYYLEKLSLPIYLNNFVFINLFNYIKLASIINIWYVVILNVILTILLSMFELLILPNLLKIFIKIKDKLSKIILVN